VKAREKRSKKKGSIDTSPERQKSGMRRRRKRSRLRQSFPFVSFPSCAISISKDERLHKQKNVFIMPAAAGPEKVRNEKNFKMFFFFHA